MPIRKLVARFLYWCLSRLHARQLHSELNERVGQVRTVLHKSVLPALAPENSMLEVAAANFFVVDHPDKGPSAPNFHFYLPDHRLLIYVADHRSLPFSEAERLGSDRGSWDRYQAYLDSISSNLAARAIDSSYRLDLIVVRWDHPINADRLIERIYSRK